MTSIRKNQEGFSGVEWLLVMVIVALIALVGYKVYTTSNSTNNLNDESASQQIAQPGSTTSIDSASDLNKAEQELDQVNPDDNTADSSQLDSQLATF